MAASDQGMFMQYCVFDGSISGNSEIQRRPYHRNCSCALHRSRGGAACSHSSSLPNVTYPIRRTWSEGSLALSSSSLSNSSSYNNLATLSLSSSSSSSQIFHQ